MVFVCVQHCIVVQCSKVSISFIGSGHGPKVLIIMVVARARLPLYFENLYSPIMVDNSVNYNYIQ